MVGRRLSKIDPVGIVQRQIIQQRSPTVSISSSDLAAIDDREIASQFANRPGHCHMVAPDKEQPYTPVGLLNVIDPADGCSGDTRL